MCNSGRTRGSRNKAFDELVDRATGFCLAELDWEATSEICSLIEQGKVTPRYALDAIKKKVFRSPYAVSILEIVTSNCDILEDYITCYEFKESLRGIASRIRDQCLSDRLLSLAESSASQRTTRSRPSRQVSSPQTTAHRQSSSVNSNANNKLPMCVICLDQPREYVFLGCGHLSTCENCITNFQVKKSGERASSVNRCPQCRTAITKKPFKVFL